MSKNIYVVIMAGGIGSRFWPFSRTTKPKQFLDVLGTGKSLLQMTYERFLSITDKGKILVVTNEDYGQIVADQLPDIDKDQILQEPVKRNTAPCIAYAAYKIMEKDPNGIMVVTPSDHTIFGDEKFNSIINGACKAAEADDKLITVGIKPNRPETGYGYIQYVDEGDEVKKVKTFTEKPELELAKSFLESGDFVWNAGIFVWSIRAIVDAFKFNMPDLALIFEEGAGKFYSDQEQPFIANAYAQSKSVSIDYGVMEKASNVFVMLGDFGWSDLGSWSSLHEIKDADENQNVVEGETLLYNSKNNFIKSESGRLIITQDLDGYLVADFNDVLLICKKDAESKFREFVADVKELKGGDLV